MPQIGIGCLRLGFGVQQGHRPYGAVGKGDRRHFVTLSLHFVESEIDSSSRGASDQTNRPRPRPRPRCSSSRPSALPRPPVLPALPTGSDGWRRMATGSTVSTLADTAYCHCLLLLPHPSRVHEFLIPPCNTPVNKWKANSVLVGGNRCGQAPAKTPRCCSKAFRL